MHYILHSVDYSFGVLQIYKYIKDAENTKHLTDSI